MRALFVISACLLVAAHGELHICFLRDAQLTDPLVNNFEQLSTLIQAATVEMNEALNPILEDWFHFHYDSFHPDWHHDAFTIKANLSDGFVSVGEKKLRLFTLMPDGIEIFNMTLPYIYMNGSYDLDGYVGRNRLFDIYGIGNFELEMTDFSVALTSGLQINSSSLCIPLELNFDLQSYTSTFMNLMDGDEDLDPLLNKVLIAILPDIVRMVPREIFDYLDPLVQKVIDDFLNGNEMGSFKQLLGLLLENGADAKSLLNKTS